MKKGQKLPAAEQKKPVFTQVKIPTYEKLEKKAQGNISAWLRILIEKNV